MNKSFKRGDRVTWNSEAGRVTGIVQKKITSEIIFKGYKRHASKEDPQYVIKSDKTDHIAIHKGSALTKIPQKSAKGPPRRK
jgi:hypothetical protein